DANTTDAVFTLKLSLASAQTVIVDYTTANGTASAGQDYTTVSGTVTFAPGERTKSVFVKVVGDLLSEGNETFQLKLSNPVNATLARSSAQATIIDNDQSVIRILDLT